MLACSLGKWPPTITTNPLGIPYFYAMRFKDVVGHGAVKQKLIQAAKNGRVPHAQLFLGNEGSGNLALALAYAQYLLCADPGPEDSCGNCSACKKMAQLSHPDLHLAFPFGPKGPTDTSAQYIPEFRDFVQKMPYGNLSDWQQFLSTDKKQLTINSATCQQVIQEVQQKPYEGGLQFMIMWYPERITRGMANRLLKTLEEPPRKTVFMLVAEREEQLLPTVVSRLQVISLPKIADFDMLDMLSSRFEPPLERAQEVVNMADGNVRMAVQLMQKEESRSSFLPLFQEFIRASFQAQFHLVEKQAEAFAKMHRDGQIDFFRYGLHIVRETQVFHTDPQLLRITENERHWLSKFAAFVPLEVAYGLQGVLEDSIRAIQGNAHQKTEFMGAAIDIYQTFKQRKA